MPSISWNINKWNDSYDWSSAGAEWSEVWGGSQAQWLSCLQPRLANFLPAEAVLEIAPGFGRWTQYLLPNCEHYVGVDLAERCVTACRERFASWDHATFHTNDGSALPMVEDDSIDLIFSFDSLVHAEDDVIAAYLNEARRVLKKDGVAVIHHSNLARYHRSSQVRDVISRTLSRIATLPLDTVAKTMYVLDKAGIARWDPSRGRTMSADRFVDLARAADLSCIGQEIISWKSPLLMDCISVATRTGSKWERPNQRSINRYFHLAAQSSLLAARAFGPPPVRP